MNIHIKNIRQANQHRSSLLVVNVTSFFPPFIHILVLILIKLKLLTVAVDGIRSREVNRRKLIILRGIPL
ncbi:hypothetical protein HOLleu_19969 [Holothuria leucospilota]|uniref:Uncharacterized protein n=1 Tax=Holothuria leucospilota TaxID=206669 RepID=A0A9Q1C0U6_HOLLE|nr:hypothetical protein HOLleu_19969 [Holothuria leucospilota]